jgi:polynucleotide 5'-kinase involved in rRNA processing
MWDAAGIDVPEQWQRFDFEKLSGVLLVIGSPDVGKTTFARYLHSRLAGMCADHSACAALIDGDPGQSSLGPPTTLTLYRGNGRSPHLVESPRRIFLGSTSPRGHMLPALVGAARLVKEAHDQGARTVVYDTSGLVAASQGGLALKQAKIDLLQPQAVFAFQRNTELEPLLLPLRRTRRTQVITLKPSDAARERNVEERRRHRQASFSSYFEPARQVELDWSALAVIPAPRFSLNRLVALEDQQGFTLGLGIVTHVDRPARKVSLLTPVENLKKMAAVRLGDLAVDPHTFRDAQLAHG